MYLPAKVVQMGGIKNKTRFYFLFQVRVCMAGRVVPMGFYGWNVVLRFGLPSMVGGLGSYV